MLKPIAKTSISLLLWLALACPSSAAVYYSCASGNGNSTNLWAASSSGPCGAGLPGAGDTLIIQNTHIVLITSNLTVGLSAAPGTDAVTINGSGQLIVASGATLQIRGDVTWAAADQNSRAFVLNAGSVLEFDASHAPNPGTVNYKFHGTGPYSYTPITAIGSPSNHATIRSNSGGGNAYFTFDVYGGGMTAIYADFVGIGDASHQLTSVWTSVGIPSGNDWNVTHSTFTKCGIIGGVNGNPDGFNWIHQHNVHSNTLSVSVMVPVMSSALTSGTRSIAFNVFDKQFGTDNYGNYGAINGFTIEDNYFGGSFFASGTAASWTRNFVRSSTADGSTASTMGLYGQSNFQNSYLVMDQPAPIHTWGLGIYPGAPNLTLSGLIFDSTFLSNTAPGIGNDGVVNLAVSGQQLTLSRNITLAGADGYGVGSLTDLTSAQANTVTADHNTVFVPSGYGAFEFENEGSPHNNRGTITNNIVYSGVAPDGSHNLYFLYDSHASIGGGVAATTDIFAPASIHHNGIFNLTLTDSSPDVAFTNQANGCAGAFSATPNAVGLVSANPDFLDASRNFAAFDKDYLGNSYPAWVSGNSYSAGQCVSLGSSGFYNAKVFNYCATIAHNSSAANSTPGIGSAWHQYWEWAALTHIKAAIASGATITDSSLGLNKATYIQATNAWVTAGLSPTNPAYHGTASDGTDIGAVAYTNVTPLPLVSGIVVDDVTDNEGHSSVRLTWNSDMAPLCAYGVIGQQVQYGPTTSYGSTLVPYGGVTTCATTNQQMTVSGLTPGHTYHMCPQTCSSVGCSVCAGVDQTVVIPALPADHLATPALPVTTAQPYPDTTGFRTLTLDPDCSNWNSVWATAQDHKVGTIIYLPAGQSCTGNYIIQPPLTGEGPGGVQQISLIDVATGTFTVPNHGFAANQTVWLDANNYLNPSGSDALPAEFSLPPARYYVVNPTANTFKLALAPNGSPIIPSSSGYGTRWVAPTTNAYTAPVILRTSAPDSALPPPGVRIDPVRYSGTFGRLASAVPASPTVQLQPFVHDIRVGPGIEVTQTPYFAAQANQFDNPIQKFLWYQWYHQFDRIAIDRAWFHGLGCPDRVQFGVTFDGSNTEIDSSVIDNIESCRPNYSGLGVTANGAAIVMSGGTYYFLTSTNVMPGASAAVSGMATGVIWITLPPGTTTPKLYLPSGINATSHTNCTLVASSLYDFPRDAGGRLTEGPIAYIPVTAGVLGTPVMAQDLINMAFVADLPSGSSAEGGEAVDVVMGPGPQRITNTLFNNDVGIAYFLEDDNTGRWKTSDILMSRNTFTIDNSHSPSNPAWNHFNSCNRNMVEFKKGQRIQVTGNIFSGQFGYCTPQGASLLLASNNAAGAVPPVDSFMADLTATHNTFKESSGGLTITGVPPNGSFPHIARRILVKNNVLYDINAWQHTSVPPSSLHQTPGFCFYLGWGGEDWQFLHNTCYNVSGPNAAMMYWIENKQEGVVVNNNLFISGGEDHLNHLMTYEGSNPISTPNCGGLSGKKMMDCAMTPSYSFLGNVLSAGFLNSQTDFGEPDPTMGGAFNGLDSSNAVRTESTVAARVARLGFQAPDSGNLRLRWDSSYAGNAHPGTDGYPIGADLDAMDQGQGTILNLRALSITGTGAVLYFQAPDPGAACYIKTGTGTDFSSYATTPADITANRLRAIAVTGLIAHTPYTAVAMCAGASNTPTVTFATN